ncbi:Mor transcription activator family protein [Propionispora vibrioides]|uniref:Mor transcription activator family protein n=1 Tax=Propionispora vibrioides TaxID=112903 RepID=A0A1H8U5F3_9FIRM|nr:Mor transcription activator family protein [Propionispora vibrioides]SEO97868.1 Mor transcription activator family protein [Propionispora vibrioides]
MEKAIRELLAKEVRLEDLREAHPATLQAINAIGVPAFVEMSHAAGGCTIYVPKFESVIAAARDRLIIKEFNRKNYTELAIRYDISEVWVRNIINRQRVKESSISLFNDNLEDF